MFIDLTIVFDSIDFDDNFLVLNFDAGVEELVVEIEVLYDDEKEIRESFTVRLDPDQNMVSELGVSVSNL